MTSRERIKNIFNFEKVDRVGISDDFSCNVIEKWTKGNNLPEGIIPQEYFDFDIRLFGFDQVFCAEGKNIISLGRIDNPSTGEKLKENYNSAGRKNKFLILSFIEPFEHISRALGREEVLTMMAEDAGKAANLFSDSLEFSLGVCQLVLDKGYSFDGAWLWGDLGYKGGLLFSTDYYNVFLFDLHKEACDFFKKNNMPVIFHSDGNINELIPYLIETGVRAIEPLESDVHMNLADIKREYGRDLVFLGGIDEKSFSDRGRAENEIKSKFKYLMKDGGYIYRADSPILEDVNFEDYKRVIELVKNYGNYS